MIPQLSKALSSGFTQKQVIDFILKKFPEHSDKIKSAMAAGFTVDQILRFLGKGKEVLSPKTDNVQGGTEFERTRSRDIQKRESINQGAITAGTLAATSLAAPMAATALKRALPTALGALIPNATEVSQTQKIPPISSQPPINTENITQNAPPIQPQVISNPKEYLEKQGILNQVDTLLKNGNTPEAIAAAIGMKQGRHVKIDPELLSNIEEYAKQKPIEEKVSTTVPTEKIENVPIAKNETVASPQGIGEVKEIRGDKALIEVDGKLHKVPIEDLEQSPLPEKDLADLYDELKIGIEEATDEEMSRMVDYAGYDPQKNTLAFLPYTGGLYVYENISPEDASLLRNVLNVRKTSGENFIGVWKKDSKSPIGSAMSQLIKKLQSERGGKGNEYSHKFETVYKSTEPAILASKKKKAEEERRKKKNAKA